MIENTLILVEPRKQMGRLDSYPRNDLALAFCELLGVKVLPLSAIRKLQAIGFTIEEKHDSVI